jgi:MoxR-like ATPase
MPSRHLIDAQTRFDARSRRPASRLVELANVDPVPVTRPPRTRIVREPYIVDHEAEEAVNIAITLGRPLLLQGDPGCGKTRLAYAVAYGLGLPVEENYIKSTTRAQDLLYTFDAVSRLYDAELGRTGWAPRSDATKGAAASLDPARYVRLGPFGRALVRAQCGRRSVVLIDEIDKADLDFPNDLLREIDRLEFEISETGQTFSVPQDRPDLRPIIFVTHNEEKPLPPAFLRRCIYHEVRFPEDDRFLARVLAEHAAAGTELGTRAIGIVRRLRAMDLSRGPGISELLDWAQVLQARDVSPDQVEGLPAIGALLKDPLDQQRAREA